MAFWHILRRRKGSRTFFSTELQFLCITLDHTLRLSVMLLLFQGIVSLISGFLSLKHYPLLNTNTISLECLYLGRGECCSSGMCLRPRNTQPLDS